MMIKKWLLTLLFVLCSCMTSCGASPRRVAHVTIVSTGSIVEALVNLNEEQYHAFIQRTHPANLEPYETEFTERYYALAAMSGSLHIAATINNMVDATPAQKRVLAQQALATLEHNLEIFLGPGNVLPAVQVTPEQRAILLSAVTLLRSIVDAAIPTGDQDASQHTG